ncbi:AAA family ATPase [Chitinophaga sedimenti]|uniref:AAA family ATPase n=1 Tax=Chitinophaga sedimenti TaxID=2033606 RepID=UPI00200307AA|nr:AAA family ATPase [Chitinophaga sedimenti]MCK7556553.1 AAA family ATPase [Chitinophaga sedimenti]
MSNEKIKRMIAKITLENFFSFSEPTAIELNSEVNILVGINGSGKSNFLRAIRLLIESIGGDGFEKFFLRIGADLVPLLTSITLKKIILS